jgi:hypothetical protein
MALRGELRDLTVIIARSADLTPGALSKHSVFESDSGRSKILLNYATALCVYDDPFLLFFLAWCLEECVGAVAAPGSMISTLGGTPMHLGGQPGFCHSLCRSMLP